MQPLEFLTKVFLRRARAKAEERVRQDKLGSVLIRPPVIVVDGEPTDMAMPLDGMSNLLIAGHVVPSPRSRFVLGRPHQTPTQGLRQVRTRGVEPQHPLPGSGKNNL